MGQCGGKRPKRWGCPGPRGFVMRWPPPNRPTAPSARKGEAAECSPKASVHRPSPPRPRSRWPQSPPRPHRPRDIGRLSRPIGIGASLAPPNRPAAPPAQRGEAADGTGVPLCFNPFGPSGCQWFSWSWFRAILTALSFPPAPALVAFIERLVRTGITVRGKQLRGLEVPSPRGKGFLR